MEHARELRERYQADPHRPRYHFLAPEGVCHPFDPQGCIYWRGRYHLFYAVQRPGSGVGLWGHASSTDLLHWRHHPIPLAVGSDGSGAAGVRRRRPYHQGREAGDDLPREAPFALRQGESLQLRIFLDRSVLEVFANGRQCMAQRIYPTRGDSTGVALFSRGGAATVRRPRAWDLAATNPW